MLSSWADIPHSARVVLAADLLSSTGTGLVLAFTAIYVAQHLTCALHGLNGL